MRAINMVAKGVRLATLFLCGSASVMPADYLPAEERGSVLRVEVAGQTVSAEIAAGELGEVLRELARQAGFVAAISGDLGPVRPQSLHAAPLDEAIRRLVGDNRVNLVMSYEVGPDGKKRLAEVRAQAAGEVSAELMEQERMRILLGAIRPPPPPPPPPLDFEPN